MSKDLRNLNQMIENFKQGLKTDIDLYLLVYHAYLLGVGITDPNELKVTPFELANRKKTIKLGIDYHGVITDNPFLFSELTSLLIAAGHEVHIVTGRRITEDFIDALKKENIKYTHLFSIADYHLELGTPMTGYEVNQPQIENSVWDRTKAEYCDREQIDVHIDDSEEYHKYFKKTTYLKYQKNMVEGAK